MPHKRIWEIGSYRVDPPTERALQIIFSPQTDQGIKDCTVLMSTIAPFTGTTGPHTHNGDEIMYVITGRGEGTEAGKHFKVEPGTIIYAPAGVEHECRNLGEETMRLFCVYLPSLPADKVREFVDKAEVRVK